MSKTLNAIRKQPWISAVDDEREIGNSIIVTLKREWEFCSEDPGCGVKGFDTVAEARSGCARREVQLSSPSGMNAFSFQECWVMESSIFIFGLRWL